MPYINQGGTLIWVPEEEARGPIAVSDPIPPAPDLDPLGDVRTSLPRPAVTEPSPAPTPGPSGPTVDDYYAYLNDFLGVDTVNQSNVTGLMTQIGAGGLFGPGSVEEANLFGQAVFPPASTSNFFPESSGGFLSERPPSSAGLPSPPGIQNAVFSDADINIAGAPDWWRALAPDVYNPLSEYQTFSNLLIPFLSPEDQRTAASNLFQSDPEQFSSYNPELLGSVAPPSEITPSLRRQFFSGERATKALGALDRLLEVSGKSAEEFGPGYNFLRGIADAMSDMKLTSGASQLTETQQSQLLSTLDPLLAQTKSKQLSAFGPIARSFVNPFFSAGALTGEVKNRFGQLIQPPNPAYL